MSEPKWTPGPWRFGESQGGRWYVYTDGRGTEPINPPVWVPRRDVPNKPEITANAQLIAAAPTMYHALGSC